MHRSLEVGRFYIYAWSHRVSGAGPEFIMQGLKSLIWGQKVERQTQEKHLVGGSWVPVPAWWPVACVFKLLLWFGEPSLSLDGNDFWKFLLQGGSDLWFPVCEARDGGTATHGTDLFPLLGRLKILRELFSSPTQNTLTAEICPNKSVFQGRPPPYWAYMDKDFPAFTVWMIGNSLEDMGGRSKTLTMSTTERPGGWPFISRHLGSLDLPCA